MQQVKSSIELLIKILLQDNKKIQKKNLEVDFKKFDKTVVKLFADMIYEMNSQSHVREDQLTQLLELVMGLGFDEVVNDKFAYPCTAKMVMNLMVGMRDQMSDPESSWTSLKDEMTALFIKAKSRFPYPAFPPRQTFLSSNYILYNVKSSDLIAARFIEFYNGCGKLKGIRSFKIPT